MNPFEVPPQQENKEEPVEVLRERVLYLSSEIYPIMAANVQKMERAQLEAIDEFFQELLKNPNESSAKIIELHPEKDNGNNNEERKEAAL